MKIFEIDARLRSHNLLRPRQYNNRFTNNVICKHGSAKNVDINGGTKAWIPQLLTTYVIVLTTPKANVINKGDLEHSIVH